MISIFERKGVMVDLETLSQKANAAIVSIGAVKFTFQDGIIDKFKVNITAESSKALGLRIDKETLDWWSKQSKAAIDGWRKNPEPIDLTEALTKFSDWWGTKKDLMFYCQGLSFDATIVANSLDAVGMKKFWHYRNEMDTRTLFNFVGYENCKSREKDATNVYHDSLGDAIAQTEALISLFKEDK